jgi:hypothetical protein
MKTPKELKARFPYMFAGKNIGISIPTGWFPLFAGLCQDIDALLGASQKNFHWVKVKEKFGAARWYSKIDGQASGIKISVFDERGDGEVTTLLDSRKDKPAVTIQEMVATMIDAAEGLTHKTCIVCGDAGRSDNHTGYVLVLCEKHARMRKIGGNKSLPPFWFQDDEDGL